MREKGPCVEIVDAINRGKGLRSTEDYAPGDIILEYTGEVVNKNGALNRAELYKGSTVCV